MSNLEFILFNWGMLINFVIGVLALLTVLIYTTVFLIRKKKMSLKIYISIMLIMSGILYFTYPDLVALTYTNATSFYKKPDYKKYMIKNAKDSKIYAWAGDRKHLKPFKAGYYLLANMFLNPLSASPEDFIDLKEYGGCKKAVDDFFRHAEFLCDFDKSSCYSLELGYQATDEFDKIIDLETNYLKDLKCHYNLGIAYMYKGEYQKAIDVFDKMKKDKCGVQVGKYNYAWAYKGLKDYKKALEILKNEDDGATNLVKASIYYDLDNLNKVKEIYETNKSSINWHSYDEFLEEVKGGQFYYVKKRQKRIQQCMGENNG